MNKKISTLLAGVLLAGSSFSAMATDWKLDATKYYQIAVGTGDATTMMSAPRLIIGHSNDAKKDSLSVIVNADALKSFNDYNSTLWKPVITEKIGSNGVIAYEMSLVNKDGQSLILTKPTTATNSFYKASYAYVGTEGINNLPLTNASGVSVVKKVDGKYVFSDIPVAKMLTYDAEAKDNKFKQYALVMNNENQLKVMLAEGKDNTVAVAPNEGSVVNLMLVDPVTSLTLSVDDLSKEMNDSFQLTFSNDVKNNVFANPFTANKLRAVKFEAMYTAATNTSAFTKNLAAAKKATDKAFTELEAAMNAVETEVNTAINYAKNTGIPAGKTLVEGIQNGKDIESAIAELDKVKKAYFITSTGGNKTVRDSLDATFVKLNSLADTSFAAAGKLPATSLVLKAYVDAAANTKSLLKKVKEETNRTYAVVDSTMNANLFSKAYLTSSDNYPLTAETSVTGKIYKSNLETATSVNLVFDQFAASIQTALSALSTTASNVNFVVSKDILTAVDDPADASFKNAAGYYAIAIVDSLINGKQAYLAVDTNYVAEKEQYFRYKADTLSFATTDKKKVVTALGNNINMFAFQLTITPEKLAGDEVAIKTFMPTPTTTGNFYSAGIKPTAAVAVIRTLANNTHREVSVAAPNDVTIKNTKITFKQIEGPKPSFKEGDVYFVKSLKADHAKKPYYVMTSTTGNDEVMSNVKYSNVPATQWFVSAVNEKEGKYTITNRDSTYTLISNRKVVVLDAATNKMLVEGVSSANGLDTIQVEKVTADIDQHLGYKFVNPDTYKYIKYTLSASNFVNPDAKVYMTMNADSAVVATTDVEKALGIEVIGATAHNMADNRLAAEAYKVAAYLGNDTLYFNADGKGLVLTKVTKSNTLKLRTVNDKNQYELLWNDAKLNLGSQKISIEQDGNVVIVAKTEATGWAFALDATTTETYLNVANAPKNVTISLMNDEASKITAVKPFAVVKRTGLELKAAAKDNDFVLGLDTAFVGRKDNFRYAYYINKPVDTAKVGAFDTKAYMVTYQDSIAHNSDTVKYNQDGLTRIGFVYANRIENVSNDSLAIAKGAFAGKADTINVATTNGNTRATWAFAIDEDNEGYYRIEGGNVDEAEAKRYVSYLNGVLVMGTKAQAQLFAVNDTELTPTNNDKAIVSEVSVIAGQGQVTIAGAAGKKVVISNILGQVKAETVIASDNETIAAPAGVVVVAIDGEEAVKAIVK